MYFTNKKNMAYLMSSLSESHMIKIINIPSIVLCRGALIVTQNSATPEINHKQKNKTKMEILSLPQRVWKYKPRTRNRNRIAGKHK